MDSVQGLTGAEIVTLVKNFVGNTSSDFQTFVETMLPLAELRYLTVHNWSFRNKVDLALTVASGTNRYSLTSATVGYFIPASGVRSIFSDDNGIYLGKKTLEELRRADPKSTGGSATAKLQYWAPLNENEIMVWPKVFSDTELRIDGAVGTGFLTTLSNYPIIPARYQDSFIKYVISLALWRENDERADAAKQEAANAIAMDIRADMEDLGGGADDPRIRHGNEARLDGVAGNLEALYNNWAWNAP